MMKPVPSVGCIKDEGNIRMMHRAIVWVVVLFSMGASAEVATHAHVNKTLGIGIQGGTLVSGISLKKLLSSEWAVEGTLGVGGYGPYFGGASFTNLGFSVLHEGQRLGGNAQLNLNWEAGVGAGAWVLQGPYTFSGRNSLFVHGVLGLSLQIIRVPLELTLDFRPVLVLGNFLPGWWVGGAGAGMRFYF